MTLKEFMSELLDTQELISIFENGCSEFMKNPSQQMLTYCGKVVKKYMSDFDIGGIKLCRVYAVSYRTNGNVYTLVYEFTDKRNFLYLSPNAQHTQLIITKEIPDYLKIEASVKIK